MSEENKILYAEQDNRHFIKMIGNLRHDRSSSLDDLINRLDNDDSLEDILIDLTDTEYLDSTNLGLLAKTAKLLISRKNRKPTIVSSNQDVNIILDSMGFGAVFIILEKLELTPVEMGELPDIDQADVDRAMMILDAHKSLMAMNKKNRQTFVNVVEILEKETT